MSPILDNRNGECKSEATTRRYGRKEKRDPKRACFRGVAQRMRTFEKVVNCAIAGFSPTLAERPWSRSLLACRRTRRSGGSGPVPQRPQPEEGNGQEHEHKQCGKSRRDEWISH